MKNFYKVLLIAFILRGGIQITNAQHSFIKWKYETDGRIDGSVTYADGIIYAGSYDNTLYALDTLGTVIWTFNANAVVKNKALVHDTIVCFSSANILYGLSKNTGELIWMHDPDQENADEYIVRMDNFDFTDSSPILNDSVVYYGNQFGNVYGVNIYSGIEVFKFSSPDNNPIRVTPLVKDSSLYVGDYQGNLYCVNLPDTSIIWSRITYTLPQSYNGFGGLIGQIVSDSDNIYSGGRNWLFQAFSQASGDQVWSDGEIGSWVSGTPLIQHDTLYVGESFRHGLLAYNTQTGNQLWRYDSQQGIYNQPIIYEDYIILLTGYEAEPVPTPGNGFIHILNKQGELIERISMPGSLFNSPIIENGTMYFGSRDNNIYAFDIRAFVDKLSFSLSEDNIDLGILDSSTNPSFEITLMNTGNRPENFNLEIMANEIDEGAIQVSPGMLTVNAADEASFSIVINPNEIDPGTYQVIVKVVSISNPLLSLNCSINFIKEEITSLERVKLKSTQNIKVYPNPVTNELYLTINKQAVEYQLFTALGVGIRKGRAERIDVADLEKGIYLIKVGDNIQKFFKK